RAQPAHGEQASGARLREARRGNPHRCRHPGHRHGSRALMLAIIEPDDGWRAELALRFELRGPRTVLAGRRHYGPLRVQRPFYPEGAPCHTYVLHPPGGVVGGDRLHMDIRLEPGSHALLTMPGATKFYRSAGATSLLQQHFHVGEDAVLEWLPQDNILFQIG